MVCDHLKLLNETTPPTAPHSRVRPVNARGIFDHDDPRYRGCVPIAAVEMSWSATRDDNKQESREQLPLALRWAIAMHNSQGWAIEKAVIDLGKYEATAKLTFVCLSRAKRLVDLLVEPVPFDRLSKLCDKPTLKIRLEEEVRLKALAVETLLRHGVRPP